MEKVDDEILGKLGMVLRSIWYERNNQLFNNKKAEECEIVGRAMELWKEFNSHHTKQLRSEEEKTHNWEPPPVGWIKMNVDAAVLKGKGTGFGAVARNENGNFVVMVVRREWNQWSPELAELKAIEFGIRMAGRSGINQMVVETDCQTAFLALENP
ncbi:unnamed protein product [Linum trigynum]|uniref:RNase H type-1 domain-containing protein n=1 Tax=Linum trigynum TaxID=586398 RepID=A0AAV2DZM7_9ROSI